MRASLVASAMTLAMLGCFGPFFGSGSGGAGGGFTDPGPDITVDASVPGLAAPDFGATKTLSSAPPPISGGTIAVSPTLGVVVVADPDRDTVSLVGLGSTMKVLATFALKPGDEPGRVAIDTSDRAHVALRRGGALVTIDLKTQAILARRDVCPSPRGVAHDPKGDLVHVACAGGELVSLPAAGGDATRRITPDTDLRDVLVQANGLLVSRFRSAEVLTVSRNGSVIGRVAPVSNLGLGGSPTFAWRILPPRPGTDGAIVVHQRASGTIDDALQPGTNTEAPSPYGSSDDTPGPVATEITDLTAPGNTPTNIPFAVLPVDLAASPDGSRVALIAAGNGHTATQPPMILLLASGGQFSTTFTDNPSAQQLGGQFTSVAWVDGSHLVAFSREPAALFYVPVDDATTTYTRLDLPGGSREDTGHAIFHSDTGQGIACASCHAEGGEDGLVWQFTKEGTRRTPSLRGTLAGTAPYHWAGELADVPALTHQVYENGMGGQALMGDQNAALASWLFALPAPPAQPASDAAAVQRGKTLFEGSAQCASCHAGARLTNNATVDVGTGGAFQVPSLVGVSMRTPLLHDGCAATMMDRLTTCASPDDQHGKTSQLAPSDLADLVAYLSTL
jgi:mono/diheme cytochrome c family protein